MYRSGLASVLLYFCSTVPCHASELLGLAVAAIRFEPALAEATRASTERAVSLRTGDLLDARSLQKSLKTLFGTGRFEDIQADLTRVPDGVDVTFLVEPAWFVGDLSVHGMPRPPSERELLNATRLRLGELFTDEKLERAVEALRSVIGEHGFHAPSVQLNLDRDPVTQQVHVAFEVQTGPRSRIGSLRAEGAQDLLSDREIARIAGWNPGVAFGRERLQRGTSRLQGHLQKMGFWLAAVQAEALDFQPARNTVALAVRIDPGPRVIVRMVGFKLGAGKLREYLPIFSAGSVDEELLAAGAANLRDAFQARGYFDATVGWEVNGRSPERIEVVYTLERGLRKILRAIEISGNTSLDRSAIVDVLPLREAQPGVRRGLYTEQLLGDSLQAVRGLYRSMGYRDARITGEVEDSFGGNPEHAAVHIEVSEGRPTLVGRLVVSGLGRLPAGERGIEFESAPGRPFNEASVQVDRRRILQEFFDAGYRDVTFDWRADEGPDGTVVYYDISHGEPILTGRTIVTGRRKTRHDVLDRRIELEEGTPLSQARMLATQRNLYDLGVFSRVDVAVQNPEGSEDTKQVLLQVEEARRWAVGAGGGAEFARIGRNTAELTNPAGDATFSPRMTLEVTRLNVWGRAHTLGLRTRLSLLQQRGLFTYEAPRWFDSDRWRLTVTGLYDTFRNVNTFTGRRLEGALQLSHQANRSTTVLYSYAYRRTTIDKETLNVEPLLVPLVSQPVRVGQLSSTVIFDRRDDPTDTTQGIFNTLNLSVASKLAGSQPNFARLLAKNSTYHRIRPRIVFARTSQLGLSLPWAGQFVQGVQEARFAGRPDPRIPLSERYFGGGANSHRGFAYNQAGPRDPATGFPLGGGSEFLNSVELRFPLVGADISGVLFHDAGNVYSRPGRISLRAAQAVTVSSNGTQRYDFDYLVHAVGMGIRYRTPIGPMRIDLAYSPNPPRFVGFDGTRAQLLSGTGTFREQQLPSLQFHFSLGQTF